MGRRRILLICHISAVEGMANTAMSTWPDAAKAGEVDLLVYGRSHEDVPTPPFMDRVHPPGLRGPLRLRAQRVLGFLRRLRRRRYALAAVAQPALARSRARGLIVSFPFVVGARRVVVANPDHGSPGRPVKARTAYADLVRWIAVQAGAATLARLAAPAIEIVASRPSPPARSLPPGGAAVYLRTDLELASAPLHAGGSAAHTEGIVRALGRRGYAVEFRSTGQVAGMADLPVRQLPVFVRGNVPTEISELVSGLIQGLGASVESNGFIYQRYSLNNLGGYLLARRGRVPLVLEANASEVQWRQEWSRLRYPRLARACERLLVSRADLIVTVSRNAADGLRTAGTEEARLRVLPNAVEVERFERADPERLHLPEGSVVICFAGLFYPWHGVRFLAKAFPIVHERHPDTRLVLVGEGEEKPLVRSILGRHGVDGAVLLPGLVPRDRVPRYLAAADVLVSPHAPNPRFVGSPIKIFEYMAAGRAVVASRVGQIGEVLRHGENALLVEPGQPQALADAIGRLVSEPGLRDRLARAAREDARLHHSWDARVDALLRAGNRS